MKKKDNYSVDVEHWSGPSGCHPDCPACKTRSAAQHTPGPWFIGKNNPLHQTDVLDERGDLIARVASNVEDANLIAAAPDLLESLIGEHGEAFDDCVKGCHTCEIIAKAEGR